MKLLLLLLFLLSTSAFAQFTPLPPLPPVENAILTKGGLLTSNGTAQVEALACANDEIIVYDSTEVNGFKCAPAPSGGGVITCRQGYLRNNLSAGFDSTIVSVPLEVGKVYMVEAHLAVASGNNYVPQADIMMGSKVLIRVRGNNFGANHGFSSAPFVAITTTLRMRALGNAIYTGSATGDFENVGNHMKVCEFVGSTSTNTNLN